MIEEHMGPWTFLVCVAFAGLAALIGTIVWMLWKNRGRR